MAGAGGGFLTDFAGGGRRWEPGDHRGKRLGLPAEGRGSVASFGARLAALLVDIAAATLIGRVLQPIDVDTVSAADSAGPSIVFVVATVIGLALAGQSPGMRLVRLRVVPLQGDPARLGLGRALLRTLLLLLLVPALVSDRDGRGLHDKAAGTVVVRA